MSQPNRKLKSSVPIAKLLASEGYTEELANQMRSYVMRKCMTRNQVRKFGRIRRAIREMFLKSSEGDKQVLGKFISFHKRMSFDTGLRIGLVSASVLNSAEVMTVDSIIENWEIDDHELLTLREVARAHKCKTCDACKELEAVGRKVEEA